MSMSLHTLLGASDPSGDFATGDVLFYVGFAVALLWFLGERAMARRRRRARVGVTTLAAAEAAADDGDFDPATVSRERSALFLEVQRRWSANDVAGLEPLVGADLMVEWRRRMERSTRDGRHYRIEPRGEPEIEYVGLVNREGEDEDRVVVRIEAMVDAYVVDADGEVIVRYSNDDRRTSLEQWWTLHPPGERWRVLSVEQVNEGRHHLAGALVPTAWHDARVSDDALLEMAMADATPAEAGIGAIAPARLDADARAAALDLALADGRFAPSVLEVAARRTVAAWLEAVDDADDALEALAEQPAIDTLLYDGDASRRTRMVVRGLRVHELTITGLDPRADPATMTVDVKLRGCRYVEDRDTGTLLRGTPDLTRTTRQRWTFALTGDAATPWRLTGVAPVKRRSR